MRGSLLTMPNIVNLYRIVTYIQRKKVPMSRNSNFEEDEFLLRQFGEVPAHSRNGSENEARSGPGSAIRLDDSQRWSSEQNMYNQEEDDIEDELLKHPLRDFVVDPTGDLYYAWQGLVGVSVFYNIIFTIMRISFDQLEYYWWLFWILDIVADAIYAADMLIQMNISYIDDGIYVTDKEQLKDNYLKTSRFTHDAIATLPLPYLTLVFKGVYWAFRNIIGLTDMGISTRISGTTLIGFCRIPRLVKYKALSQFFGSMESRTNAPDTFRAFNLIMYLLVIIHWISCVYYCISWYEGFGVNTWVYPATEEGEEEHMLMRKYTVCFYWSFLTLTTIGGSSDPETNLEYIFTGLTFFNGVFVFAAVVGNVGDIISNMNAARTEFQAKMDDIKRYMVHHRVPDSLQRRIKKWFDYSWARTHGVDETSLLQTLPDKLRARIQIQIHLKTLKKVTIFEKCENGLLCELVLKLRAQIFSPRDYVCRRNEIGKEMYIINHGMLECIVTTETGERIVVATLSEGKYFGEIALLSFEGNNRRTADVRSVGYSELLVLSKKALMSALVDYPEARKQLEYQAQLRISSNRKMSSALRAESSAGSKAQGSGTTGSQSSVLRQTLCTESQPSFSGKVYSRRQAAHEEQKHLERMDKRREAQFNDVNNIITELRAFDCLATKRQIIDLEASVEHLHLEIGAKTVECETVVKKLRDLENLHQSPTNGVPLNGVTNDVKLTNGHSRPSRSAKQRDLEARISELAPVEERVSERTRKILETLRRRRLKESRSDVPHLLRQSSFCEDVPSTPVSNFKADDQELPTVQKYLRNLGEPRVTATSSRFLSADPMRSWALSDIASVSSDGSASAVTVSSKEAEYVNVGYGQSKPSFEDSEHSDSGSMSECSD